MSASTQNTQSAKCVVILGDFIHEGLIATIGTLGYRLIHLTLSRVKPKTWVKRAEGIRDLRCANQLAAVVVYMPTPILLQATKSAYEEAWGLILNELRATRSMVFVFEDNLGGDFSYRDWQSGEKMTYAQVATELEALSAKAAEHHFFEGYEHRLHQLSRALEVYNELEHRSGEIRTFLNRLHSSGVEIAPFASRSDVTIRLQEFFDELEAGVFLRLYIPNARYQADQLMSFLRTFERYLRQVEGKSFSIDSRRTAYGVVCLFRSDESRPDLSYMDEAISRFDGFMKVCQDEPNQAEKILEKKGVDSETARHLVANYSRDFQRLVIDVRHEFEHKALLLRQRLENQLLEVGSDQVLLPQLQERPSALLSLSGNTAPITINLGSASVVSASPIQLEVDQIINGGILYTEQDRELIGLFEKFCDKLEAMQLRSDLDQLKDKSSAEATRKTSRQRMVAFLHKAASQTAQTAE